MNVNLQLEDSLSKCVQFDDKACQRKFDSNAKRGLRLRFADENLMNVAIARAH